MHGFVSSRDKTTLEIVPIPFVLVRGPFFRLKKKWGSVGLKTARKGLAGPDLKQKKRVNSPNKRALTTRETLQKRKLELGSSTTSKRIKVRSRSIIHNSVLFP